MKKLLLSALTIIGLAGTGAFAQTAQGTFMLGGNLSFGSNNDKPSSSNPNETTNSYFTIAPMGGYFFTNNFAAGLIIGYSNNVNTTKTGANETKVTSSNFFVGPYARYYWMIGTKMAFFGDARLTFGSGTQNTDMTPSSAIPETKTNNVNLSITPGFTYFITPRVGLEMQLNALGLFYNNTTSETNGIKRTNDGFNLGLNSAGYTVPALTFGFNFYMH